MAMIHKAFLKIIETVKKYVEIGGAEHYRDVGVYVNLNTYRALLDAIEGKDRTGLLMIPDGDPADDKLNILPDWQDKRGLKDGEVYVWNLKAPW